LWGPRFEGHGFFRGPERSYPRTREIDLMQRPSPRVDVPGANCTALDGKFLAKYPSLAHHIGDDFWDDNTPRTRSTLTLYLEEGSFKAALNDKEADASVFRTGETLDAVLAALEKALASGTADWRSWGKKKKGK